MLIMISVANRLHFFRIQRVLISTIDVTALPRSRSSVSLEACHYSMSSFTPVHRDEIKRLITASPNKSCNLDPIPTELVKMCQVDLLDPMTAIINCSLLNGVVPKQLKHALITPVLKKKSLDPDVLGNYRPISNLPFLSKVLEKVVANQLHGYLELNGLFSKMQSAYRRRYSTETALLRVQSDILLALDEGCEIILVLLDFSAAFDTIDHSILLSRLRGRFGITDMVLSWLTSYLSLRSVSVCIGSTSSPVCQLLHGVPQGSVLGPVLFTLYVSPLEDVITAHGINCMMYADDSQLYTVLKHPREDTVQRMERCIMDIKIWTINNKLFLHDGKTEAIHISSKFRSTSQVAGIKVGDCTISPVSEVRNLGVTFDKNLCMDTHITNICKCAFLAIRDIGKIRRYLDKSTTERLVHAFISSRLDYCNSILLGLPSYLIERLQKIQNTAARLVALTKRTERMTPILKELHWLPVAERIIFKTLMLTYKCVNGLAPEYLAELLHLYQPCRTLRSSKKCLLQDPGSRTATFGKRSFALAAPSLWNNLPEDIKQSTSLSIFKSSLKSFLYNKNTEH